MARTESLASSDGATILIVDDDPDIRELVCTYLRQEGFLVSEAASGEEMWSAIAAVEPCLVLLDVTLPGQDGLSLARMLRQRQPNLGIMMISGKEDVVDRVVGLEVGADDYLVKPFHLRELLARIRSILRRGGGVQQEPDSVVELGPESCEAGEAGQVYAFAEWRLDPHRRSLEDMDGRSMVLTSGEFDLLMAFVMSPNRVLSRSQLLDSARTPDAEVFDRSIDVQVGRLRRKIEKEPKRPALIKTVRNAGYIFNCSVKKGPPWD